MIFNKLLSTNVQIIKSTNCPVHNLTSLMPFEP